MTPILMYENYKSIFDSLIEIFKKYNSKINLSSFNDTQNIKEKHIIDSLQIFQFENFQNLLVGRYETNIVDIGTGGGFPGLILAICMPFAKVTLVDSIGKKINAVKDISKELNIQNLCFINDRAENIKIKYDISVSRAVSKYENIYTWSKNLTHKNGYIYLYKSKKEQIDNYDDKIEYTIGKDPRVIYEFKNS